jgi:hypothetical protein
MVVSAFGRLDGLGEVALDEPVVLRGDIGRPRVGGNGHLSGNTRTRRYW